MDGLLGIGSAGGQSSGTDGAALASRLETLRKERAQRTPLVSKQKVDVGKEAMAPGRFNHTSPQGAAPTNKGKRSNRRKKGKKGKR